MSAKKSWDIARKPAPKVSERPVAAPAKRPIEMRRAPQPKVVAVKPSRDASLPRPKGAAVQPRAPQVPLKQRRAKARKAIAIYLSILAVLLIGLAFYVLWLPALRIQELNATGPGADDAKAIAWETLGGTYFWIVPRDSIFLLPEQEIRSRILEAHTDIQAVSLQADGLNAVALTTTGRAITFLWCGTDPLIETVTNPICWKADSEGLIFAQAEQGAVADLRIYAVVDGMQRNGSPLTGRILHADTLPATLQMVKSLRSGGASIVSVYFREDESDFYTTGGTRITYVRGKEAEAAALAASAFPTLNLNDGSIEYVDLRFANKVFLKRKGDPVVE